MSLHSLEGVVLFLLPGGAQPRRSGSTHNAAAILPLALRRSWVPLRLRACTFFILSTPLLGLLPLAAIVVLLGEKKRSGRGAEEAPPAGATTPWRSTRRRRTGTTRTQCSAGQLRRSTHGAAAPEGPGDPVWRPARPVDHIMFMMAKKVLRKSPKKGGSRASFQLFLMVGGDRRRPAHSSSSHWQQLLTCVCGVVVRGGCCGRLWVVDRVLT